tara:strand:+ start:1169 stop:2446 length:1278 start_codon:yes stop_codon:yes gene_type:complete
MKEDFLHYIWNFKLFNTNNLKTSKLEDIKIIKSGQHNTDAGPDFFNAKIQIDNTIWVGNVEIHIKSSDWNKHKHQYDNAYDNVILHVVYENDEQILNSKNQAIPTVALKSIILENVNENYNNLNQSLSWIPCANQISAVDSFTINSWLERLAYERLERKAEEIKIILAQNKNDWESTFYQLLVKYFGLKVNALPFELLAQNTPLKVLEKHRNIESVEAILFGQAGFLNETKEDEYYLKLQKEYDFLKNKFKLTPIDMSVWKFLRLRPYNFPTIRIAQIAQLFVKQARMFNKIVNTEKLEGIQSLFNVSASNYWDNHFNFKNPSKQVLAKQLGSLTINNIIINVVIPVTFVYGKTINDEEIVSKSLNWLEELKAENNSIITNWKALNINPNNALQSQALIELKNNYCSEKKCLNCSIGNKLLKQSI